MSKIYEGMFLEIANEDEFIHEGSCSEEETIEAIKGRVCKVEEVSEFYGDNMVDVISFEDGTTFTLGSGRSIFCQDELDKDLIKEVSGWGARKSTYFIVEDVPNDPYTRLAGKTRLTATADEIDELVEKKLIAEPSLKIEVFKLVSTAVMQPTIVKEKA